MPRQTIRRFRFPILALAGWFALMPSPAFAYIDPGSGSIVLQMILAALAGGVFFFRNAISRFFGFFRRSEPTAADPAEDTDTSAPADGTGRHR